MFILKNIFQAWKKVSKWNSGDPGRSKDYYFAILFGS